MIATAIDRGVVAVAAASILERGFAVLPGLMSDDERREASALLDGVVARGDGRDGGGAFGWAIHPLCPREPRLCRWFAHPTLVAALATALDDEPRLAHTGA